MIETHDLFLRAVAIPAETNKTKKENGRKITAPKERDDPSWPDVLVIDTESRTPVDQSLTFGVWQRCRLVGEKYGVNIPSILYTSILRLRNLILDLIFTTTSVARKFSHTAGANARFHLTKN